MRARGGILKDAPGEWRAGGWCGLDLPDAPGTREERRRPQIQLRRQPQVPLVPQGAPPGPRYWWCPGWLELPLEDQIPRDAWFFPKNVQKYVPDIWFVPLWSPSKQSGKDDPDCVQMVWRKRHIAECPGQPQIRGGDQGPPSEGGLGCGGLGRVSDSQVHTVRRLRGARRPRAARLLRTVRGGERQPRRGRERDR